MDLMCVLRQAVDECREGIVVADMHQPDRPVVFVNSAFERLTGYTAREVLGMNCRFLQGDDREQAALDTIRHAINEGRPCLVTLRNFRKDGTMFFNELSLSPIRDERGEVAYFLGIQKDVTAAVLLQERLRASNEAAEARNEQLAELVMRDRLTGVMNRRYFDMELPITLAITRRELRHTALFMIDIDYFKLYNDTCGHLAGDEALRRVAEALSLRIRQSGDSVCRYGGEEFAIVATGMSMDDAARYAEDLRERVASLRVPHLESPGGYLSISVGYAVAKAYEAIDAATLTARADRALYDAKRQGRDRVAAA